VELFLALDGLDEGWKYFHLKGDSAQGWTLCTGVEYFYLKVEIFPPQGGKISTKGLKTKPPYL